ncbi:hypothetical protein CDO73_10290 [Saccharibacillus sp. O23]|uniref:hypothetical protein n=1 Tax=Saccharibacillus sp. O23 TaxID=2009338 RepID=UPI000B4DF090|nr:hypothetical protein [Saccharibacillus sp. O23]OWR30962.1 hypothetical protein CDO73_10290 [Saccharibacillus sp. O23]
MEEEQKIKALYERLDRLTMRLDEDSEEALIALIDLHAEASEIVGLHDIVDFVALAIDREATPRVAAEIRSRASVEQDPWLRNEYRDWLEMPGVKRAEAELQESGERTESRETKNGKIEKEFK